VELSSIDAPYTTFASVLVNKATQVRVLRLRGGGERERERDRERESFIRNSIRNGVVSGAARRRRRTSGMTSTRATWTGPALWQSTTSRTGSFRHIGTAGWSAPETFQEKKNVTVNPYKADAYALGVVIWEVATEQFPGAAEFSFSSLF